MRPAYYRDLRRKRARRCARSCGLLVGRLKADGARIAGYGAAAKACTLLNYVGIGAGQLECLVDKSTFKQGWFMPG